MTSDQTFVQFIAEQIEDASNITYRKMFGDYAVYCDGKVVALVCDNQLFIKPTAGGRLYIGEVSEAAPYPGARLHFLIDDACEDREWISGLIKVTARELAVPKPKAINRSKRLNN